MKTPNTGLDLRVSMTPFETPSLLRRKNGHALKRSRVEGDDAETSDEQHQTPKSAKRMRSVHSALIIDAGDLLSSPASRS